MSLNEGVTRTLGEKEGGGSWKALIVDDSQFMINNLTRILNSFGCEIAATAQDGMEAVEKYKEMGPTIDFVTLDITMPKMDGQQALKELLKINPNAVVIMVSALGHQQAVTEAIKTGAKYFIVKPFQREAVFEVLKKVLKIQG